MRQMPTGGRHIVHMADSDLIALLNGEQASSSLFGRDEEDRALLDEDGLPNDKFLEVVKAGKIILVVSIIAH